MGLEDTRQQAKNNNKGHETRSKTLGAHRNANAKRFKTKKKITKHALGGTPYKSFKKLVLCLLRKEPLRKEHRDTHKSPPP